MRPLLLLLPLLALGCAHGGVGAATGDDQDARVLRRGGVNSGAIACNREQRWGETLRADSEAGAADLLAALAPRLAPMSDEERAATREQLRKLVFWRLVRAVLLEGDNNNFGVVPLRGYQFVDGDGVTRPVLLFRTGFTPAPERPGSCYRSLLAAGVRHVVNLFDGDIPAADLVGEERRAAAAVGASYQTATDEEAGGYGPWRDLLRKHYEEPAAREKAMAAVARLVREQLLRPGGAPPRGHLHVHCGGGMHRTGMIVGVVEKCVNGAAMAEVEAHYRRHVAWRDPAHPGGAEEGNLRFLRDFDCARLAVPPNP